eukprot:TRINITY_DN7491_c0_g1_i3.p1 TRINITY_DN7491_c0_g1~~TRINITY_DN7491_c0_g1_i3.p1  ORF type:complete len:416 (+),score=128.82 TRINITY_DN7491_c0_g1_i3:395-1642(+)
MRAEDASGLLIGRPVEWHYKQRNDEPKWYSARSLDFVLNDNPKAVLVVELWDRAAKKCLGSTRLPLAEAAAAATAGSITQPVDTMDGSEGCSITFQVLNSEEMAGKKTVYFVRHAESAWNKAQGEFDLYEMGRTTDHPLSEEGRRQAENLRRRISEAAASAAQEPWLAEFLKPEAVYVSPLTRAMQTASIGLEDVLTPETPITVTGNVREKQNLGGLDSTGQVGGREVVQRGYDELIRLYNGQRTSAIDKYAQLKFDVAEVEEQWWVTGAESKDEVVSRSKEFMSQITYSPHKTAIVVGHSHFFRELLKEFQHPEALKAQKPKLAAEIGKELIENCGIAKVVLDPAANPEAPIVDIELVLGTQFAKKKGFAALRDTATNCCAAADGMATIDSEFSVVPEPPKAHADVADVAPPAA